jgi:hypothetical protein
MAFHGRRALGAGSILFLALSIAGADDGNPKPPLALMSVSNGPPTATAESGVARRREHQPPVADPFDALRAPLAPDELSELAALAHELGAPLVAARERAALEIKTRFGARAAGPLLDLCNRDLDVERRFRERALFGALVFDYLLTHAPRCGWLGVRWQGSSTEKHAFAAHVVEAVAGEPAARSGLLSSDDIVAWNGEPLESQVDFIDRVQMQAPGTVAALTVERDGHETIVRVTMGTRLDTAHVPELPYPTFERDVAQRRLADWVAAWRTRR